MVTQSDIAKLAKVDRTSVSKILCGAQLEHFSDDVVEKVKSFAIRLGYKHRHFKNALKLGFLFPVGMDEALDGYTYAERTMAALLGASKVLEGSKHSLQIVNINYSNRTFDFDKVANTADVFIIWELTWEWADRFYAILKEKQKDFVVINRVSASFKDSYIIHESDEVYIKSAIDIFCKYGHSKIAGVFNDVEKTGRLSAMKEAFKQKGLEHSAQNVFSFHERDADGCRKTARLIAERGFTAVFVQSNDMNALDLVIELGKLGLRVPEDISVLGNHKKRSLPSLGLDLSSFETPWYEMGKRAAEFLIAGYSQSDCSKRITHEVLKQKFYEGNTIRGLSR
ncbi:MAG: hypothetical protein A2020_07835 [Lentisphaerae bacterium GWF2_45_14]|nr:MAG: hypothetical protein A2020_07835 [Lentisphaerae bacterium GWF2_45_14]